MCIRLLIFAFIIFILNSTDACDLSPVVEINENGSHSEILGTCNETWKDERFYAFRGIPYVKAPVGNLRFKDPQPLETLPSYINARYDGHDCPSIYATNASEDCLVLNVYTKDLNPTTPLPVIVFIHPGGLYIGSSLSSFIGPEYLLTKNIVLVTFNYRLGPLGFLNLGTPDIPGNAGFKDQIFALRWTQRYIRHFGGDPKKVTLMGYSAGGLSVSLHLASTMAQDLFHQAIVMSGALPPQTMLPRGDQMRLAQRQAELLNCSTDMLSCLQRHTGTEIAATLRRMFDFGKDNPVYLWLPVIEHDHGQERFLADDYYGSLRRGAFHRVPLLIGHTDGEFCTSAADLIKDATLENRFYAEFAVLAPKIFMYEALGELHVLTEALRAHYLGKGSDFGQLCNLFSDAIIRFGAQRLANLTAKYVDVYAYKFSYRGEFSNLRFKAGVEARVEHMDDLMYLFRMQPHHFNVTEKDAKIVELYTDFIYDFVINGKISSNGSAIFPYGHTEICTTLVQKSGTNFAEAKFWDEVVPL